MFLIISCCNLGQYNGRVSDECYMDVDTCDNLLYAVLFGAVTRAKMHIYDEDKPWDVQRTVVLPSDGLVTINVGFAGMSNCLILKSFFLLILSDKTESLSPINIGFANKL